MSQRIPADHPLRKLFRSALDKAFTSNRELYSPGVAAHLGDEVLCDFIHIDRIYRLKNAAGGRLESLQDMLPVSGEPEGPERRLEVDRYIGDFTLFMVGFFPACLRRNRWASPQPMVSRVGKILVTFEQPVEYYTAEGRNAYTRAAETARLFDPESRDTFALLAKRFEGYLGLLQEVKQLLAELPEVREVEDDLDSDDP